MRKQSNPKKGLTFAEKYFRQRQKQVQGAKTSQESDTQFSSEACLSEALEVSVAHMEETPKKGLARLKGIINKIPPHLTDTLTEWRDQNNFDILHHCILNNQPESVELMLKDGKFFPPKHQPPYNPYAHLAACLGHKGCLNAVIEYRPDDFFKASLPSHVIKIPEIIKARIKYNDNTSAMSKKGIDKMINKIKASSEFAMTHADDTDEAVDVSKTLETELETLERASHMKTKGLAYFGKMKRESFAAKQTKPDNTERVSTRSSIISNSSGKEKKKSVTFPNLTPIRPSQSLRAGTSSAVKITPTVEGASTNVAKTGHIKGQILPKEHSITIYWDVFKDFEQGVMGGAGVPLNVKMKYLNHPNKQMVFKTLPDRPNPVNQMMGKTEFYKPHQISETINASSRASSKLTKDSGNRWSLGSLPERSESENIEWSLESRKNSLQKPALKKIEVGVRGKKKYKEFQLKIEHRVIAEIDESVKYMDKTPLTLAAERGHLDCVELLLEKVVLKKNPIMATKEPLTLATKARSPEAIVLLLDKNISRLDFQSAVLTSIRELYPDCLSALLSAKNKEREQIFEGMNLFHVLYSQSLIANYRYEMMPVMTKVLIDSKEDVNAHNIRVTYPLYTLINCAFNITIGKKIFYYIECLELLLDNKANPHFDEIKSDRVPANKCEKFSRQSFRSAIHCIFGSAKTSVKFFEKSYWSFVFMKKFVTSVEKHDKTSRKILNDVIFDYMECVNDFGLDRTIIKSLLRYGGNPDAKNHRGKYAVNMYFDQMLPFLTHFEIIDSYEKYRLEIENLMILCRSMTPRCLSEALHIFMDDHMDDTPIQALAVCRFFVGQANELLRSPRKLLDLTSLFLWIWLKRNKKAVGRFTSSTLAQALIIP